MIVKKGHSPTDRCNRATEKRNGSMKVKGPKGPLSTLLALLLTCKKVMSKKVTSILDG